MKPNKFLSLCFCLIVSSINAQDVKKIEFEQKGIAFSLPETWKIALAEEEVGLSDTSFNGTVLLLTHYFSTKEELVSGIYAGLIDPLNLSVVGAMEGATEGVISGLLEGQVEGQVVQFYVCSHINKHGEGITLLSYAAKSDFSEENLNTVKAISQSFEFKAPVFNDTLKNWQETLNGAKLTYVHDFYDSSAGGDFALKEVFGLCPQGHFQRYYREEIPKEADFPNEGEHIGPKIGTWSLKSTFTEKPILELVFNNGDIGDYLLSREGEKIMLNGKYYLLSKNPEQEPRCN